MRYLSVCSGIEAATVAWHPLGWTPVAFAEIERFPSAVLAHHYPSVPNLGDFTTIEAAHVGTVDLLVGGTPCQSFSVAGKRLGLDDPRGNLAIEYLALARRLGVRWLVWENVPGVLSSNGGRDVGAFLGILGECGYGFAYRVLDAQYFGLAQRRQRVFVVGHLGDWRPAAAVLLEPESLRGDPAPSRGAREGVAGSLAASTGGCDENDAKDGRLIAHTLRGEGHDASEDGTGRGVPLVAVDYTNGLLGEIAGTIEAAQSKGNRGLGVLAFDTTQATSGANRSNPKPGDPCHPLAAGAHAPAIAFNARQDPTHGEVADAMGTKDTGHGVMAHELVRRLTPRECERLQGFPDDYTAVPYRGKPAADGPRYKALGNSMAVPVMAWIGRRIELASRCRK